MLDFRPVGYVIGLLIVGLGLAMAAPAAIDGWAGSDNWRAFALAGCLTAVLGGALARACKAARTPGLSIPQTFLLTAVLWLASPLFGALPLMFGAPGLGLTDAYFEAASGFTTAGATVITGLDDLPRGVLLWRIMLHWFGGIGIIVAAMAVLPALRIGGMQLFKAESFDTFGKVLPRASEIAASVIWLYVVLTAACAVAYAATGMALFDSVTIAMSTVATGGFANSDSSFGNFPPAAEYVAAVFMLVASLPFVRLVQLAAGATVRPLLADTQVHAFLAIALAMVAGIALWRLAGGQGDAETVFRKTLFNGLSILTGTGFASEDYSLWGAFPAMTLFILGLVGGCSGSATCAIKVFRFQVLAAALSAQVRAIHSPNGVFLPRYEGRAIDDEVLASVMAFFYMFALTLGLATVALAMMGLDPVTAISAAAASLACVGPGFGPIVGPSGNYAPLPDAAKWLLALAMIMGRLELLGLLVLFTRGFWRA